MIRSVVDRFSKISILLHFQVKWDRSEKSKVWDLPHCMYKKYWEWDHIINLSIKIMNFSVIRYIYYNICTSYVIIIVIRYDDQ